MDELFLPEAITVFDGRFFEWHRHKAPWAGQRTHVTHIDELCIDTDKKGRRHLIFKQLHGRKENLGIAPEEEVERVKEFIDNILQIKNNYPSV